MTGKQIYESKKRMYGWFSLPVSIREVWNKLAHEQLHKDESLKLPRESKVMFAINCINGDYHYTEHWIPIVELMDEIYELEREENNK